jgi:hypothetical protein
MRAKIAALCLLLGAGAALCSAQAPAENANAPAATPGGQPSYAKVYCSGFVKDTKVPDDARIASGEQIGYKVTFAQGERVYLNQGSDKGVRAGDRFMVVRATHDPSTEWFRGQFKLTKAMGILYEDLGQLKVVNVLPNGYLVVEGVKRVQVNSENQVITIRGVVRPYDLDPTNAVPSDRVAQMEVQVNGKGVIGDSIRRPWFLYRLLLGLLPF